MHRIIYSFIALYLFNTTLYAQGADTIDPLAPGENIYRHFTGTIGNHKAVLDLRYGFQGALNYGGSTCYFTDEGGLDFFIISKPPSNLHTELFRAQVFPENIPLNEIQNVYSIFVQTARFEFTLSHDSLKGKWYNPNAQEQLTITLKENNTNALPLEFKHADDSILATGKKNETLKAVASYRGIQPSPKMKEKDAAFITNAIAQFIGGSQTGINEPHDPAQICFKKFFGDYKAAIYEGQQMDGSSFSGIYTLFPVYNENGFLVLQKGGYQYDFGNKEYTDRNLYLCLDVKNKKILKLDDILIENNDMLGNLLEKAFRKKYQLEPGKKLTDLFTSDKMPLTDNYILVNKGLIFSYSPAKIFRDNEDIADLQEMRLFLSYDELGDMLKPDFKNRLGLK